MPLLTGDETSDALFGEPACAELAGAALVPNLEVSVWTEGREVV